MVVDAGTGVQSGPREGGLVYQNADTETTELYLLSDSAMSERGGHLFNQAKEGLQRLCLKDRGSGSTIQGSGFGVYGPGVSVSLFVFGVKC